MSSSSGCLSKAARFLAWVCGLLFVLTLPLTILTHDIAQVLFSPDAVSGVLAGRLVDSGLLRRFVVDQLLTGAWTEQGGARDFDLAIAFSHLSPADREAIADILLPPEWLKGQIAASVGDLYRWIDDDRPVPELSLDLRPLKAPLLSGGVEEIVEVVVDSWPSCSVEETQAFRRDLGVGGDLPLIYCEPPEPIRSRLTHFAASALREQLAHMPGSVSLAEGRPTDQGFSEAAALKRRVRLLRALARWGWLLPLSLLGVVMALVVRSWKGLTRWWGVPLLAGGLLSYVPVLFAVAMGPDLLAQVGADLEGPAILRESLQAVVVGFAGSVLRAVAWHATLAAGGGLALLVIGRLAAVGGEEASVEGGTLELAPEEQAPEEPLVPPPPPVAPFPEGPSEGEEPPEGMFG